MAKTPKFDLDFRPDSYWDPVDPATAILTNIKGANRREMVRDFIAGRAPEELGEIESDLLEDSVDEDLRVRLGHIHPSWMGGEYLPDYLPGEVEIARIVLDSATRDVYSIRARRRRGGNRIYYRIVDEYGADSWTWTIKSSTKPLTLGRLIRLIDTADVDGARPEDRTLIDWFRDSQLEVGAEIEDALAFVDVQSEFYPQLQAWYIAQGEAWAARVRAGRWSAARLTGLQPSAACAASPDTPDDPHR